MRLQPSITPSDAPAGRPGAGAAALATGMVLELLRAGQRVRFVARGSSMWPAVRDGALVEVTPCPASVLRPGDLGAYATPTETLVVHRLVAVTAGGFQFAGDTLSGPDAAVPDHRVLGRAVVVSQPAWHLRWPGAWHLRPATQRALSWLRVHLGHGLGHGLGTDE